MSFIKSIFQKVVSKTPSTTAASGFTTSYTDPNSGAQYPDAWIQIRLINYTPNTSTQVVTDVYTDEQAYVSGKMPVCYNIMPIVSYGSDDWNTYFDLSVFRLADHDIQTESLAYLQAKLGG